MSCGIYKFENKINGQVYIGQSVNIEKRYKQHKTNCNLSDRNKSKFYQALNELGFDNFSFTIIEHCLPNELNEKEIYWINYYNSVEQGYNTLSGGTYGYIVDRELIYKAWDEGLSVQEIANKLEISKTLTREALHSYPNYSIEESHRRGGNLAYQTTLSNQSLNKASGRRVYQYDLNGNYINDYSSVYEAARQTNTQESAIRKVISGERQTSNDFIWFDSKQDKVEPRKSNGKAKNINQYDINDNYITSYISLTEAAKAVNGDRSLIGKVCRGIRKTAYGYKWKFKE